MIGQTISRYRILSKLGEGATSIVYVAEDTDLGRQVAVKVLTDRFDQPHFRARMRREARAISSLSHPRIATIHEYGETPKGQPYIVMELVKGQTLSDLMRSGTLTLARVLEIVEQIAEGLLEAHRRGIIHRDIKPSNVALSEGGDVKILDFGLAKRLSDESPVEDGQCDTHFLATQTREGVIVGTPMYLSPEQALGVPVDSRSDLFSLGSVLYECIAGRAPFDGRSAVEICAKVIREDPLPPSHFNPDVPPELDRLALKALAKNPEARYQRAAEMLDDLRTARRHLTTSNAGPLPAAPPRPASEHVSLYRTLTDALHKPRVLSAAFASALCVSLLIFFAVNALRSGRHTPSTDAQRWYAAGVSALYDGSYYTAAKRFEEAVRADDRYVLAHARLAETYAELDKIDRANEEILTANTLTSRSQLSPLDALYLDAVTGTVRRNFADAIGAYAEVVQRAPGEGRSAAYVDLGRAYERDDKIDDAIDSYTKAAGLAPKSPAPVLRLGVLYGRKQDLPKAEDAFKNALDLYQSLSDQEGRAEVLYQRGALLIKLGRSAEAREQLQKVLDITAITDNLHQRIRALLQLSIASYGLDDKEQAEQYVTSALNLAQANNIENLTVQSLNDLGNFFFVRGRAAEAERYFTQALQLAQRANARRNEARARLSLGSLYVQQDNPAAGVPHIEQALRFYEQGGYRKEVLQALTLLGQADDLVGDYDGSLQSFQRLLQLAEGVNDQSQIALSHKGLGAALMHQERYAEALQHFERSYAGYNSLGNELNAGYSLVSRADAFWRLGRLEEAHAALSQAAALIERPGGANAPISGQFHIVRASMSLGERNFREAVAEGGRAISLDKSETKHQTGEAKYIVGLAQTLSGARQTGNRTCAEAVEMASKTGDPRLVSGALLALAEAQLEDGEPSKALLTALRAREVAGQAGRKESQWRALLLAGRASYLSNDTDAARDYLARADGMLSSFQETLGADSSATYLARPDIRHYREQLVKASSAIR
jgi:serine/threonine protein kinase/Tfp pilus assembly protein PilF